MNELRRLCAVWHIAPKSCNFGSHFDKRHAMAASPESSKTAKSNGKGGQHDGDAADFSREQDIAAYRQMLLIRRFEEKAGQLYGMGFIGGNFLNATVFYLGLTARR